MREIAAAVPRVATIAKPRSCSCAAMPTAPALSESVTVRNTVPLRGSRAPAAACAFANAAGKSCGHAHHLAGRAHLRPEQRVRAGEAVERHHRLLDRDVVAERVGGQVERRQLLPQHHPARHLGQRDPGRLGDERHRPRRARVRLDHVEVVAEHRVLHVHQPDARRARARAARVDSAISSRISRAERVRRQHAGRVAGVDPGLLDVLHDAADPDVLAVADRVDVDLDRVLQEAVEEDLAPVRAARDAQQVVLEPGERVDDLHRAAAEHVARAHEQREADARRDRQRLLLGVRGRVGRRLQPEPAEQRAEAPAVLGQVDRLRLRCRAAARPPPRARRRAAAASGRRTARSRPRAARPRRSRARPRASAARSTGGRRCRSRSRPSRGCS